MRLENQVIITVDMEDTISKLESIDSTKQIVKIVKEDNFLVEDAKLAIEKAYITSDTEVVIILAAKFFSPVVQNKLLKIIEEPPPRKEFILVTNSKATILSTIRSRLPILVLSSKVDEQELELDMSGLSLATAYEFTQKHKHTNSIKMKNIIEQIAKEAIKSRVYNIDNNLLSLFSNTVIGLNLGSPPSFILNILLLKLLAKKLKKR